MADKHYSTIVIGGGPAGATAAFSLASRGIECCLIDKRTFPRDKLCGGLLTLRSKKLFERVYAKDWSQLVRAAATGVRFFDNKHDVAIGEEPAHSELFFTQRFDFDHALLKYAVHAGAEARLGVGVEEILLSQKAVILSDGSRISFDYAIGADGVNSICARSLFGRSFNPDTIGFALEIDVPTHEVPNATHLPEIHFGFAKWGYGWIFPKGDFRTIGIGGIHDSNPDLKESFNAFLAHRLGYVPKQRVKGQFLPFGDFRVVPGNDTLLLCGDAAGLVDSITGEGIAFAMQSGNDAALSIMEAIKAKASGEALPSYISRYREISDHIRASNRYRWFIFPPLMQRFFLLVLPDSSTMQRGYLDLIAGDIEYDALPHLMWKQFKKGILKLSRRSMESLTKKVFGRP